MNSEILLQKHTAPQKSPRWLTKNFVHSQNYGFIKESLARRGVRTVCQEARCPNISGCFGDGKLTFMILGDVCTRSCSFCAAKKGSPLKLASSDEEGILEIIKTLGLTYVILTSVTRDDLRDGGLSCFLEISDKIKRLDENIVIEALTPDFRKVKGAAGQIARSKLDVFAHNMETIDRLYAEIRSGADYRGSLSLLRDVKELSGRRMIIKSGFMLGLGETEAEVIVILEDLRRAGVDIVTIGQYLRPRSDCRPVEDFIEPQKFAHYKHAAEDMGIPCVNAGSFVRSSYNAEEMYKRVKKQKL